MNSPKLPQQEHVTVLLEEAIEALAVRPEGCYLDATFGRGGHSRLLLQHLNANGQLYALDRDPQAAAAAEALQDARFHFVRTPFSALASALPDDLMFDGILFDLGVSSPQLDRAERGFSFQKAGPIDMRMDNEQGMTALMWLEQVSQQELAQSIRDLGGEPHRVAQRIAQAIKSALPKLRTTLDLAEVIALAVPKKLHRPAYHPATQTFQAIRMRVNDELGEIQSALQAAVKRLKKGAYLVVISFHAGEDAVVKRFLRQQEGQDMPAELPVFQGRMNAILKIEGGAVRPSAAAIEDNPRCRSAILRRACRL